MLKKIPSFEYTIEEPMFFGEKLGYGTATYNLTTSKWRAMSPIMQLPDALDDGALGCWGWCLNNQTQHNGNIRLKELQEKYTQEMKEK